MKKLFLFASLLGVFALSSCKNYEPTKYGPIEFEGELEGPIFAEGVVDANFEFDFNPEAYQINRNDVYSMVMSEINISTTHENGFGDFQNISFILMADGVSAEKVGTINIEGSPNELKVPGLSASEIKKFKNVKTFYLEITAVAKPDIEDNYDNIDIEGSFVMDIMVPKK